MRRLVLVADHPQRDHRGRVVERPGSELEQAVLRDVKGNSGLGLPDDETVTEAMLAERAADRTGVQPCLERRHAGFAVKFRTPGLLVGIDPQAETSAADLVMRR